MQRLRKPARLLALLLILPLAACPNESPNGPNAATTESTQLSQDSITIASGGASGPYNMIATALAEQYHQILGVDARTQTTGASIENMNLLAQGKVDMAFVQSDVLSDAIRGSGSFTTPINNVRQIAALYPNHVQIISRQDANIQSVDDLRGKRVAVGDERSAVELNTRLILAGHDIDYDDISVNYLGDAAAADALRTGQVDAAFVISGLPNAAVLALSQNLALTVVPIAASKVAELAQDQHYFVAHSLPAGAYGNEGAVPTAAIMNALVVRADLSDDDVYLLTRTFFDQLMALETAHPAAADISFYEAQTGLVAPLHPGAQRLYDERSLN